MSNKAFTFPGTFVTASHAGGVLTGGGVLTVTATNGAIPYTPGTAVAATALTVGLTYRIKTVGTTNWQTAGAPTNATVGTLFTAVATSTGTGTAVLDPASCELWGQGMPTGVHITGCLTVGGAGGSGSTGTYSTDAVDPLTLPSGSYAVGRHFVSGTSGATSYPVSVEGTVQSVILHQNAVDTGSVAANYVQGSVDGGQNWVALSSALASSTGTPSVAYESYSSGNQIAMSDYRILVGTITGTANIGAAIKSSWQTKN